MIITVFPQTFAQEAAAPLLSQDAQRVVQTVTCDAIGIQVQHCVAEKQPLGIAALVVIGIGGSELGIMAVQSIMYPDAPIYYLDSLDTDYAYRVRNSVQKLLQNGKHVLLNVISKSGNTTETIAHFQLMYKLMRSYEKEHTHSYVVVTTDKHTKLWDQALQNRWSVLEVPAHVGGRYSLFTPVVLFPLAMIGLDIASFIEGGQTMYTALQSVTSNTAYTTACALYACMRKGYAIHNFFVFDTDMYALGKWWQQLMGESLGKAVHSDGSPVRHTLVPIVSMGTQDLHSVGQLFLAAVAPVVTTFVTVKEMQHQLVLSTDDLFTSLVPHMQGKSMHTIMHAISSGVMTAYRERSLPYIHMEVPKKSMYDLGSCMQFYMHQVIYMANLLDVNPFDQPEVELYKRQVRKNLADA